MNAHSKRLRQQRTQLGKAIKDGDAESVSALLDDGIEPGRNQFELSARRALDSSSERFLIVQIIYDAMKHDSDFRERASRYVECTLVTMGAHADPARQRMMDMMDVVPGRAGMAYYGGHLTPAPNP